MAATITTRTLDELLASSAAGEAFKRAVQALAAGGKQDRIAYNSASPPVKVLRFVMKLLETRPDLALERVEIQGQAGCSDYVGTATAQPGPLQIEFEWDCRWRAEGLGWRDPFGDPDQLRAARELGYQCFRKFELRNPAR